MGPSWPYYAFLISWIHCLIVVWFAVTIETQSTDVYSEVDNSTNETEETTTNSLESFTKLVMPTCPPPNNLHLLCDVTLAGTFITCKERADIVELCWNTYGDFYKDSHWSECSNSCQDVVNFIAKLQFINIFKTTLTPSGTTVPVTHTPIVTSSKSKPTIAPSQPTKPSSNTSESSSETSTPYTTVSPSSSTSQSASTNTSSTGSSGVVTAANTSGSETTISDIYTTLEPPSSMAGDVESGAFPPLSYVYPIFGGVVILIEVVVLCYLFCFRKRRNGSPVGRYRRTSTGSMVIEEEMVEAETTSPTQALCNGPGPIFTDDMVFEEDKHIFRSYLNLRYMDDTSAEGTPEKVTVK